MPQAGTAWVPVYPDTRRITPDTRRAFEGLGPFSVPVEPKIKDLDSVRRALQSLPSVVVPVTADDRELAELRRRLQELGDRTIGVNISAGQARAELADIGRELDALSGRSADLGVRVDTGAASAALSNVDREASRIDGRTASVKTVADTARAVAAMTAVLALADRLNGSTATVNVTADTARALAGMAMVAARAGALGGAAGGVAALGASVLALGPAGAIAGAGLATAVLGFGGIGKALTALSAQQDAAGQNATANAKKQAASAQQVQSAQERVTEASTKAGQARSDAARDVSRAEDQAAKAVEQARARVAAADRNLSEATAKATQARSDAARDEARARDQAAKAVEQALARVAAADRALSSAVASAAAARADASRSIERAETQANRSIASARQQAQRSIASATTAQAAADTRLQRATRDLVREQSQLTRSWELGRRALEDLQDQVDGNALDQRQAAFDLADARADLAAAQATGDADQIARAQLAVDKQLESMDQLSKQTRRLGVDNADAQRAGVMGSEAYRAAVERVRSAQEQVGDAAQAAGQADHTLAQARLDGARSVAQAEADGAQRIADARREGAEKTAAADARVGDARRALREAEQGVEDARVAGAQRVADAQEQGSRSIASADAAVLDARRSLLEAERGVEQAQVDGAQRVADAREQGNRSIATADAAVLDAQRALQKALADTGDTGSAAADKVATALGNLPPAARSFALYLWSLKPALDALGASAAAGLFPPLQDGIAALVTQLPTLITIVGLFGAAMGGALGYILTQLASPFWMGFFSTLAGVAGPILLQLAQAFMAVAGVVAQLILALLPLTPMAIDLITVVAMLVEAWSPFIVMLVGQLLPVAGLVLQALMPLGPVLGALAPILAVLATAFAMVLGAVLQVLAPVLVALTPLITQLALAFATQLVGGIQAATPFLVGLATWMSQHPQLVLGIITVLSGLFTGWRLLATILGGLLGPLFFLKLGLNLVGVSLGSLLAPLGTVGTAVGGFFARMMAGTGILGLLRSGLTWAAQGVGLLLRMFLVSLGPVGAVIGILALLFVTNEQFRGAVMGVVGALLGLVGQILAALMPALAALMPIVTLVAQVFAGIAGGLATALVPVITALARVIEWLSPILAPLAAIFLGIRAAMILWTVAQWALNTAMAMNPITLVVIAIAALIGAVVWAYQSFGWFRTAVDAVWAAVQVAFSAIGAAAVWLWQTIFVPAWTAIAGAVSWAWNTILWPIISAIGLALRVLGAILFVILVAPFLIAWNLISAAVSFAWNNVILPVWNALVGFIRGVIVPVLTFLYFNVFKPIWDAIGAVISFIWNSIILPVYNAHVAFLNTVIIPLLRFLYFNVVKPIWDAIGAVISFVWNSVILPLWNALVGYVNTILIPLMRFLYNNVVKPMWDAIGAAIRFVWEQVIKPAWDALVGGLMWVRDRFRDGVSQIGQIWAGIKAMLAKPINFMIDVVWNRGVVPAWNKVAGLVGLGPIQPLGLIPEFAEGGPLSGGRRDSSGRLHGPGTGTSDSILASVRGGGAVRVSRDETVMTAQVSRAVPGFLAALNARDGEALQAAGAGAARAKTYRGPRSGFDMNPMTVVGFAVGGQIAERIAAAKSWLSGPARGAPYVYGGGTNPRRGMDCSSMQSAVTHILSGRPPDSGRIGATSSMPWGGFVPGINGQYAIGNKRSDHMAATLAGQNVEQHGPNGNPFTFPSRWGADNGYFPQKFHLQEVGGAFVSGGAGSGFFDFLTPLINTAFDTLTNPAIDLVRRVVGEPPPEWRRVPPAFATKARDTVKGFVLSRVAAFLGSGTGGPAIADVGGLNPRQRAAAGTIIGVAKSRRMPRKAAEIGVATGMQESQLGTIGYGRAVDHDSLGLFQQRPSQGWGSPAQIQNDVYASNKFFDALSRINYMGLPHTVAAQQVQRSAFPNAYAKWVPLAVSAVNAYPGGYDAGGIAEGIGWMWKGTGLDERVLPPTETQAYPTLTRLSQQLVAGQVPVATAEVAAARAAAMTSGSGPEFPREVRLTSGRLRFDRDGLVEIIDGRLELVTDALIDGRQP